MSTPREFSTRIASLAAQVRAAWRQDLGRLAALLDGDDIVPFLNGMEQFLSGPTGLFSAVGGVAGVRLEGQALEQQVRALVGVLPGELAGTVQGVVDFVRGTLKQGGDPALRDGAARAFEGLLLLLEWYHCHWSKGPRLGWLFEETARSAWPPVSPPPPAPGPARHPRSLPRQVPFLACPGGRRLWEGMAGGTG